MVGRGASQAGSTESEATSNMQLHTSVGCALHDFHNSLKWAAQACYEDVPLRLKALYVGTLAFRHSVPAAAGALPSWLAQVLMPVTEEECYSEEHARAFYAALQVPADMLSFLCSAR
eukprot:1443354-Amphidinium_carterae.1